MAKKLYAQQAVAIAGVHFAAGQLIKGVEDEEQIAICIRLGKVADTKPAKNKKAPEKKGKTPKNIVNAGAELTGEGGADADAEGEGADADDTDGAEGDDTTSEDGSDGDDTEAVAGEGDGSGESEDA